MIEIQVRLFGALRKYGQELDPLRLQISEPATAKGVKEALGIFLQSVHVDFNDSQLLDDSAVANESHVLPLDHVLSGPCTLLILPPVCGG